MRNIHELRAMTEMLCEFKDRMLLPLQDQAFLPFCAFFSNYFFYLASIFFIYLFLCVCCIGLKPKNDGDFSF